MLRRLPALLVLLAAVGALWLFFWSDTTQPPPSGLDGLELGTGDEGEPARDPLEADGPGGDEPAVDPPASDPPDETVEPEEAARETDPTAGGLQLRVTDKAGELLERTGVTARVLYPARPDRPAIHGVVEEDGAIFQFRELPLGAVQVHVDGDLVMPGMLRATILGGKTSRRSLTVNRAGAVAYDIQLADGSRPKDVRLSLLDDQDSPVRARYRPLPVEGTAARPRQGRLVRMPPQGVVFGLRAGSYTLKASALGGAEGAEVVSVGLGAATRVIISLEP